ncbi:MULTISPECIES: pilus assembly protein TadG-related protein [unclassified Sphingomonas]|uniref:TadE/TadG family type IV pilus assembly protein n=1 Tax=unclassified Sphingomonas TaxID=196159 RepID=UPI00226A9754|nr:MULTISPECIES: pilus assembly protein TadG-related protein [unclassified Sphingomonas]
MTVSLGKWPLARGTMVARLVLAVGALRRNRRGSTLALMAAGLFPMIASVGAAIDLARLYITTSQMQAGVDAAALAGANAFDNKDDSDPNGRKQQVIAYFRDNFPDSYMGVQQGGGTPPIGGTKALEDPIFTTNNGVSQTVVNAVGLVPMTFMSIFGIAPHTVSVTAHAEFQPHPLEVMVVLDNTGSMQQTINGVAKIDALKSAMHSFINVLYQGSQNAQPNLAMGIINYTNQVNVGSLLKAANIPIETIPGFSDRDWASGDAMGWKGCVANDETVNTMSSSATTIEPGAYDVTNELPGDTPRPGSPHAMNPIRPLIMPPLWLSTYNDYDQTTTSSYYNPNSTNNLYWDPKAGTGTAAVSALANSASFKRFFYRYYIAINNGAADMTNDVIVAADKTSYYDPTAPNAFNPLTNTGTDFYVRADKIPYLSSFKAAAPYVVTSNNTNMPSPNWQCPEPGLPITYNVSRATFDNFIDQKVWAILPANGTMHHTGFIWGWRILSRYTKFVRTKPDGSGAPVRAMVFMTDGKTELGGSSKENDKVYTAYGSVNDQSITTATENTTKIGDAANLRFAKACAIANSYVFPDSQKAAQIYVVAINRANDIDADSQARLKNCGKNGYWLSTTPTDLSNAFTQIARTLVDVHLTQ